MTASDRTGKHSESWGERVIDFWAATLELRAPNEVWRNGTENRLQSA